MAAWINDYPLCIPFHDLLEVSNEKNRIIEEMGQCIDNVWVLGNFDPPQDSSVSFCISIDGLYQVLEQELVIKPDLYVATCLKI